MSGAYTLTEGTSPLVISMPHSGLLLDGFDDDLAEVAFARDDTDWHIPQLYEFATDLGATVLQANYSRYVIDLNRDPSGISLYPGQNVTELCPISTFGEGVLYIKGKEPTADEIKARVKAVWKPYHAALKTALERIKAKHGFAVLLDAHSIRSIVPRFFEGRLPDFNIGTNGGLSCGEGLGEEILTILQSYDAYKAVLNGRFKGGYITRAYGQPNDGIHAVQLELSQITYMDEKPPYSIVQNKADKVLPVLKSMVSCLTQFQP